ncbi:hypothetical protein FRB91_009302 [Serendipita sp. 411]|nr:hypothetical protein FRB91_009302 [Serendipita sp. 411]
MSTYEFQISTNAHVYQQHSADIGLRSPHSTDVSSQNMATPSIITPGPTPQPIIIQYDAADRSKHLYGSGDQDEGFTLQFANLDAFHAWKEETEKADCVDYFKVDAHTSKAVPPRFKEHVKLSCSRHTRVGQKKYIKKFPDRTRKTPSKKIEGVGCPSTISYKTYHDSPMIRVNYVSNHSHDIGPANLPYTKKYRKQIRKTRQKTSSSKSDTTKESNELDEDGDSVSAGPDTMSFTSLQVPPSPPASTHEGIDMSHLEVPYGPVPQMNYDRTMSSQNTSPSVSHSHQPQPQPQPQLPHTMPQRRPEHLYLPGPQPQQNPQMQDPSRAHMNTPLDQAAFTRQRQHSVAIHTPTHESAPPRPTQSMQQYRPQQQHHEAQQQQLSTQAAMSHQHPTYQSHHLPHPHHPPMSLPVAQPQPQPQPHPQSQQQQQPQPPPPPPPPPPAQPQAPTQPPTSLPSRAQLARIGWDQLSAMFEHIRRHQGVFDYNHVGIRSLEAVSFLF